MRNTEKDGTEPNGMNPMTVKRKKARNGNRQPSYANGLRRNFLFETASHNLKKKLTGFRGEIRFGIKARSRFDRSTTLFR